MDYSALSKDIDSLAFDKWLATNPNYQKEKRIAKYAAIPVVLIFLLVAMLFYSFGGIVAALFVFVPFLLILIYIIYFSKHRYRDRYLFATFALDNNLHYYEKEPDLKTIAPVEKISFFSMKLQGVKHPASVSRAGIIFNAGHSRKRRHILENQDIEMFDYEYVTGSGKHRKVHNWSVAIAKLPRSTPHILLDSKSNNFFALSNLPVAFDKSQKIDAGLLSEYYDVYVPDKYGTDVLSFISPEVVEVLITHHDGLDIEIVDDNVIIYIKKKFDPKLVSKLVRPLLAITKELVDNIDTYRDERATTMTDRQHIAQEGLRLKKSVWPGIISLWFGAVYIALRLFGSDPSALPYIAAFAVISVTTLSFYIYKRDKNKLK